MHRWLVALLMMNLVWPVMGEEHPACLEVSASSESYRLDELRRIARSCREPEVAELYFNRAHHQQMLAKYDRFERSLLHYGDRDNRAYIESYRIHIGLAEAFASVSLRQRDLQAVRRLNRLYDEIGEIAEMRFKGYDLIADRLERKQRL